jgi:chemotaxis protein methyltransferase CheR
LIHGPAGARRHEGSCRRPRARRHRVGAPEPNCCVPAPGGHFNGDDPVAIRTASTATMTSEVLDHLSHREFQQLANFIHEYSGIKMPPAKKTMVEGRLRRRVRAIGARTLTDYCRYLFDQGGLEQEAVDLIDAVTTNKTDFFREPEHFRFLVDQALPELLASRRATGHGPIKVWSAASSIGAEPYTLAMVMAEFARVTPGIRTSIVATDICSEALNTAVLGIYPEAMITPVPIELRKRYLLRAKSGARDRVRIVPELRQSIAFSRLNLMVTPYAVASDMHIVFCRNILIYFDKATQRRVLGQICDHMRPGGFLFLGHSETLTGFGLPLQAVATTVFRRL